MTGIFSSAGFRTSYTSKPFYNVELYQLMCDILNVKPNPHNGTWSNISPMLLHPNSYHTRTDELWSCILNDLCDIENVLVSPMSMGMDDVHMTKNLISSKFEKYWRCVCGKLFFFNIRENYRLLNLLLSKYYMESTWFVCFSFDSFQVRTFLL